ncbi:nucleotidyltransferase domain-containing protein [Longimonas halophila]|uniref:nucleotidyltransferase domain-containing protein n=1 Tax=Longimonas halophila TaxID=1469170 RepID=UPI001141200B|nr:nucleotidyltransferase domain-containing protein [Longimonas halophila]
MATVQTKQDLGRIGLFGSLQQGESAPESDVDLLIEFVSGEESVDSFMAISLPYVST